MQSAPILRAGVDEAGRGALCGNVVVALVVLPSDPACVARLRALKLRDSKTLSARQRDVLYEAIQKEALEIVVAERTPQQIDASNILRATLDAMREVCSRTTYPVQIRIDGSQVPPGVNAVAVVKGDAKHAEISCAGIVAKVTRDRQMIAYAERYPEYGFEKHKGYGSRLHYENLRKYGPCDIHRTSFRLF